MPPRMPLWASVASLPPATSRYRPSSSNKTTSSQASASTDFKHAAACTKSAGSSFIGAAPLGNRPEGFVVSVVRQRECAGTASAPTNGAPLSSSRRQTNVSDYVKLTPGARHPVPASADSGQTNGSPPRRTDLHRRWPRAVLYSFSLPIAQSGIGKSSFVCRNIAPDFHVSKVSFFCQRVIATAIAHTLVPPFAAVKEKTGGPAKAPTREFFSKHRR